MGISITVLKSTLYSHKNDVKLLVRDRIRSGSPVERVEPQKLVHSKVGSQEEGLIWGLCILKCFHWNESKKTKVLPRTHKDDGWELEILGYVLIKWNLSPITTVRINYLESVFNHRSRLQSLSRRRLPSTLFVALNEVFHLIAERERYIRITYHLALSLDAINQLFNHESYHIK